MATLHTIVHTIPSHIPIHILYSVVVLWVWESDSLRIAAFHISQTARTWNDINYVAINYRTDDREQKLLRQQPAGAAPFQGGWAVEGWAGGLEGIARCLDPWTYLQSISIRAKSDGLLSSPPISFKTLTQQPASSPQYSLKHKKKKTPLRFCFLCFFAYNVTWACACAFLSIKHKKRTNQRKSLKYIMHIHSAVWFSIWQKVQQEQSPIVATVG